MPESIRDQNTGETWKIDVDGIGRVGLYVGSTASSSSNPIPTQVISSSSDMSVINAIEDVDFDLFSSSYSKSTNITSDYILDSILINFSTTEVKTITISDSNGIILWGGNLDTTSDNKGYNTTKQNFNLIFEQAFKNGTNIQIDITQTSGNCEIDVFLKIKQGGQGLVGNPILSPLSKTQIVDSNGISVTESYFSTLKIIDLVHNQTHRGRLYSGGYFNQSVSDNGNLDLLIHTGANPIHINAHADVGGDCTAKFYEDTTINSPGTSCIITNHNRTSNNITTVTLTHTPSINTIGNQLNSTLFIPGGAGGKAVGSSSEGFESEIICKANTYYLIRITNFSGQSKPIGLHITFYEQY